MSAQKSVLKRESAGNIVFDFQAKEITHVNAEVAQKYVNQTAYQSDDFRLDPLAAEQSGIAELRKTALNDRIEEEALQQLKSIQEKAYKEAYDIGLTEGTELAFSEKKAEIEERLRSLDQILLLFEEFKQRLLADHESHIVEMVYFLASKIAMREIQKEPASILPVAQQILGEAQSEEVVTLKVSQTDLDFLEKIREKSGKAAEPLRRVKLEATEGINSGGCLLESNFGSIDATIETRVARAWESLAERLPQADQRSGSGEGHGA